MKESDKTAVRSVYMACETGDSYSIALNREAVRFRMTPERLDGLVRDLYRGSGLAWCRGHDVLVEDDEGVWPMAWSPSLDREHAAQMAALYQDINPNARVRVVWRWIVL